MTSLKDKITVMQAALDGKVIERRVLPVSIGNGQWEEICAQYIGWDWITHIYRIKPAEPDYFIIYSDAACGRQLGTGHAGGLNAVVKAAIAHYKETHE